MSEAVARREPGRGERIGLGLRVWALSLLLRLALRWRSLPAVVAWLERPATRAPIRLHPRRLGRFVWRALHVGPFRARCLIGSLVLFRLLRRQGDEPELVLGLPPEPKGHEAHAWIELGGFVVGPPPGRLGHEELTRYGRDAGSAGATRPTG